MSVSAASSPRHVLDKNPLDDPRLLKNVDHSQSFANQANFVATTPSSPSFDDGVIDEETFQQILELDEETDREFSSQMAEQFCLQARTTIQEMKSLFETAIKEKSREQLRPLGSKGHFLKGSSAAIGANRVHELCETAQHLGNCRDEEKDEDLSPEDVLKRFNPLLKELDLEIIKAERWLVGWFENLQPSVVLKIEGAVAD